MASPAPLSDRPRWRLLLLCFVLSGAAGLIYQSAWMQQLGLVFGASELAVAAVLAAYMGGLTAGALLAGRWLVHLQRPLLVYALLEVAIAGAALAVPTGLDLATDLRAAFFGGPDLDAVGGPGSGLFYLVATFAVLAVPTLCMGATLPILSRWAVRSDQQLGPRIALLYGANTAGAAAGVLAGAFWLLPKLGLGLTVWVAIGLNGLVALAAWGMARGPRNSTPTPDAEASPRTDSRNEAPSGQRWVLPAIAGSGFIAFGWEVVWSRLLAHLLGGSIYAYGLMLATFLVGIAAGSLLATTWARDARRAGLGFVAAQLGVALGSWGAFLALDGLAGMLQPGPERLMPSALVAALVLLPGALMMGAAFPCAVRLRAAGAGAAGTASAQVYAWNTVGAIAGAVAVGFFLLPAWRFAGMATALIAGSLALAAVSAQATHRRRGWSLLLAAGAALALLPPPTPWRTLRTAPISGRVAEGEVAYYAVGRSSTVLLYRDGRGHRLTTNGLPESLIQAPGGLPGRLAVAQWLSLLPVAARPEARSMLIVGLGGGLTVTSVAPTIERLDVVELEPAVVAANRIIAGERATDPLADPRLRLYQDDARSALELATGRYDAVVSQPSHPWTASSSHLYTREFFERVDRRLAEDGVFVQWIGLKFVDEPLLRSLVASLNAVFPFVEVYTPGNGGALLFLAGRQSLGLDADGFAAARDLWHRLGVLQPQDLDLARRLTADDSRAFAAGAALTTDRRNRLQIRSPKVLVADRPPSVEELFGDYDPLRPAMKSDAAVVLIRRLLGRRQIQRARRLASEIADPAARRIATGLVDLAEGRRPRGRGALLGPAVGPCSPSDTTERERLAALLALERPAAIRGNRPELVAQATSCDDAFAVVLEGWRQLALRSPERIAAFDDRLAAVTVDHPLHGAATILRLRWRRQSSEANYHRQGLGLLEPLLSPRPRGPALLAERVLLAAGAGDRDALEDALEELKKAPPGVIRSALQALPRISTERSPPREVLEEFVATFSAESEEP
ncbi:MAG: fused MFS/spermidine synthase [Acidobacteriota bacterium]